MWEGGSSRTQFNSYGHPITMLVSRLWISRIVTPQSHRAGLWARVLFLESCTDMSSSLKRLAPGPLAVSLGRSGGADSEEKESGEGGRKEFWASFSGLPLA